MKPEKTNVMRILEQKKVPYLHHTYPHQEGEAVDGVTVAELIGRDAADIFKTLVTVGASKANYVFVIPVAAELDLKKAAKAVGEKSIDMLHVKQLTPLTGYVRGGCSPVGMKKHLKTVLAIQGQSRPTLVVSAGKIGHQVEVAPELLCKLIDGQWGDVCKECP